MKFILAIVFFNIAELIKNDKQFNEIISQIIGHEEVQKMDKLEHHANLTCLSHSLNVSYFSYKIGRKLNFDYVSLARAGLLHDFFLYDWKTENDREGLHGFTHSKVALSNANRHFTINELESDIILKHMWPLNPKLPKYKESYLVVIIDKLCAIYEMIYGTFYSVVHSFTCKIASSSS